MGSTSKNRRLDRGPYLPRISLIALHLRQSRGAQIAHACQQNKVSNFIKPGVWRVFRFLGNLLVAQHRHYYILHRRTTV